VDVGEGGDCAFAAVARIAARAAPVRARLNVFVVSFIFVLRSQRMRFKKVARERTL
jgi:hypothetical protein